jgi:histidine triad (HIT) family protein
MAYDRNNIFARILRNEIPAYRVYEDADTLAFMDVMPQSDGHTLVIPKTEAENIFDVDAKALAALMVTTQKIAAAVRKAFQPPGMRILQFNFPVAGQTVFHLHFHIVPFYETASLKPHAREMAEGTLLAKHAAAIRAALK